MCRMASAAGGARAARQARRPVEGCQLGPESDAFEHKVPSVDRFRRPWPEAIRAAAQKIGANRNGPENDDFPDAGNRRVGPNIGRGPGLVARRENLDNQDRIGNDRFLVPGEELRDGHPDRYLGNRTHDFRLAQNDGRPNQPTAGPWQDTLA
jgi:hypothetical protein